MSDASTSTPTTAAPTLAPAAAAPAPSAAAPSAAAPSAAAPSTPTTPTFTCPHRSLFPHLGDASPRVSLVGFGTSCLGSWGNEAHVDAAVARALERGVNYFDTSPFYRDTRSETLLGDALRRAGATSDATRRARLVVQTKCGRTGDGGGSFDFSAAAVTASVEASMRRLGVDYLDVVVCHDIEYCAGGVRQIVDETLPALAALRRAGKVRALGVSGFPLDVLDAVVRESPHVDLVLSYAKYSLLTRELVDFAERWRARRIDGRDAPVVCVSASAFAMGILASDRPPPAWHPAGDELVRECHALFRRLRDDEQKSLPRIALQYALRFDAATPVLVGLLTADEVDTAIDACARLDETRDDGERIAAHLQQKFGGKWK